MFENSGEVNIARVPDLEFRAERSLSCRKLRLIRFILIYSLGVRWDVTLNDTPVYHTHIHTLVWFNVMWYIMRLGGNQKTQMKPTRTFGRTCESTAVIASLFFALSLFCVFWSPSSWLFIQLLSVIDSWGRVPIWNQTLWANACIYMAPPPHSTAPPLLSIATPRPSTLLTGRTDALLHWDRIYLQVHTLNYNFFF